MKKLLISRHFAAIGKSMARPLIAMPIIGAASFLLLLLSRLVPTSSTALQNGLTAVFFALVLAFALLAFLCELRMVLAYYHAILGRESAFYLTLPAPTEVHILAPLAAGVLWQIILLFAAALTVTVGMLLPFELLLRAENVSFLSNLTRTLFDSFTPLFPFSVLFAPIALLLLTFAAITLGSVFFERKPALGRLLFLLLAALSALLLYTAAAALAELLPESLLHLPSLIVSLLLAFGSLVAIRKAIGKRIA